MPASCPASAAPAPVAPAATAKNDDAAFFASLGGLFQLLVEDLQQEAGQVAREQVPASRWLGLGLLSGGGRLGRGTAVGPRFGDGLVELLLQLFLRVEQVAQRQLKLVGLAALRLVAVDAALEQLVFVRQVDDGLAEGLILSLVLPHLRLHANELNLQRRDGGRELRQGRRSGRWIGFGPGHGSLYTRPTSRLKSSAHE